MKVVKKIDDHIRERTRPSRRIKVGDTFSVQIPPKRNFKPIPPDIPLKGYKYDCRFFNYQRGVGYSNDITVTANTLTYAHSDDGLGANSSYSDGVWTDALPKTWTIDEWVDHYLKVDSIYYKILSNTANTITINEGSIPDDSSDYDIVPFVTNQFVGAKLSPDTSVSDRLLSIVSNTETVITIGIEVAGVGTVTTGDGSAPYNSFVDSSLIYNANNDFWNNYSILFTSGSNNDEVKAITDYIASSGSFVTGNFTNSIDIGDDFSIRNDMLFAVGSTAFLVRNFNTPTDSDFTSAPGLGNVIVKTISSIDGEINEAYLSDYYNSIYSIELHAKITGAIPMDVTCTDSIKITLTPGDGTTQVITDSGNAPNIVSRVSLNFTAGQWHRLDIYFYADSGVNGFSISSIFSELIDAWRHVVPPVPSNLTAIGGDSLINLSWLRDERYRTQIWSSPDDTTYTLLATADIGLDTFTHQGLGNSRTMYYKIRYQTDSGDLSTFTDSVNGTTLDVIDADNIVITGGNYPYVKESDVLTIVLDFREEMDATPTVELYDSGGDTSEDAAYDSVDGTAYTFTYTIPSGLTEASDFYFKVQCTGLSADEYNIDSEEFTIDGTAPTLDATKFLIDSDGITNLVNEEVVVGSSNFIIGRNGGAIDTVAGVQNLYAQPCLSSTSTSVGSNQLTDTKLIGWDVGSLANYYLYDSANAKFAITSFTLATGVFVVSGTPSAGAYRIVKSDETDPTSWQYTFTYQDDSIYPVLLNASMQSNWLYSFLNTAVKYGFIISADDLAGNIIDTPANWIAAVIHYNPEANFPLRNNYFFWDGSQEVYPNSNGWLNSSSLYLRVIAESPEYALGSLLSRRWNGSWEEWQEDSSGSGLSTYTYDIDLSSYEGENKLDFYLTNKQGVPTTVTTVEFKYDKTKPTWTIADASATGGFNRIRLGWSNEGTDALSGPSYVNIYRNTSDSFPSSADPIGQTSAVAVLGFTDHTATVPATTYYYWAKVVDFAGNEQETEQALGNAASFPVLPADVDGALRIVSNDADSNTSWLDSYGISVPIEAVVIRTGTIASGSPSLNYIKYSDDGITYTDVANPTVQGVGITVASYVITDDTVYSIRFDPVQYQRYWKVKFNNVVIDIGSDGIPQGDKEILDIHFDSILSADLIVAGVLRLAVGLTIKALGTGDSQFVMDATGMEARNQAGTPVYVVDYENNYHQIGIAGGSYYQIWDDGVLITRGIHLLTSGDEIVGHGVNWQGDWSVGHGQYYQWDSVRYDVDGKSYICIIEHTSHSSRTPTNATYWEVMVDAGVDGLDGADGTDGSEGVDSRTVNLTTTKQAFNYDSTGALIGSNAATITATALNTQGTVYYQFFEDDVSQQNTTSNTWAYTAQASMSNMPEKIEVQIREGSSSGTILARDQMTIYGVKPGRHGLTILLTNEAHTIPCNAAGTPTSYTNSGTDIRVWVGGVPAPHVSSVSASPSFAVSASGTGITPGSESTPSTNICRYANASGMSTDPAKITFTITIRDDEGNDDTYTRVQSFSKSIEGDKGDTGDTGDKGDTGDEGARGSRSFYVYTTNGSWDSDLAYNTVTGAMGDIVLRDVVTQANGSGQSGADWSTTKYYSSSGVPGTWTTVAQVIDGNLLVLGSVAADRLDVDDLSAISADIGTITAGSITGLTITGGTIQTATGNVDKVVIDSTLGIGMYNKAGGWQGRIRYYNDGDYQGYMGCGASGIVLDSLAGKKITLLGITSSVDLQITDSFSMARDTTKVSQANLNHGGESHILVSGTANVSRIYQGYDGQLLFIEASSGPIQLLYLQGNSGNYKQIRTSDGFHGNVTSNGVKLLMYSSYQASWMLINNDH